MTAARLHLVRHGEVFNPRGILYERIPGYHLSDAGHEMARAAADHLVGTDRSVTAIVASPLQRAQESAAPIVQAFGVEPVIDERVIEPWNSFAGKRMKRAVFNPANWWLLRRPSVPTWGEPYAQIVARMRGAMDDLWQSTQGGDAVIVSHQAPIWLTHLAVAGLGLPHDPRSRRCALSSITSFEKHGETWREVGYVEPASTGDAKDVGAV